MKLSFRCFEKKYFENKKYISKDTTSTVLEYVSKLIAYKTKDGSNRNYTLTAEMKDIFKNLDLYEKPIDKFLIEELSKSL